MAKLELKQQIQEDLKDAMRSRDSNRVTTLRMLLAAIKQREIDEQITLSESQLLAVIEKQVKLRRDAVQQFTAGGRPELAAKENSEIEILQAYLPQQLSTDEITSIVVEAINEIAATSIRDMGKVMGLIKPKLQGQADMSVVSAIVKAKLNN